MMYEYLLFIVFQQAYIFNIQLDDIVEFADSFFEKYRTDFSKNLLLTDVSKNSVKCHDRNDPPLPT